MNPEELNNLLEPELPEEEPQEEQPQPTLTEKAQDLYDQGKDLKERFGKKPKPAGGAEEAEAGAKEGLRGVEKETAEKAANKKILTHSAQEAGKAGARTAATAGAEAAAAGGAEAAAGAGTAAILGAEAATGPAGWVAGVITLLTLFGGRIWTGVKKGWKVLVYIAGGLLILLAFLFFIPGGKGVPQYPTTPGQQAEAVALSAMSGNTSAQSTLIFKTIAAERNRMSAFKGFGGVVYASNAAKSSALSARINEVLTLLDALEIANSPGIKKAVVSQIQDKLSSFASDFPELVGYSAVHGYPLTVPGVIEAAGGDCGAASILMVSLYYKQTPGSDVYDAPRRASRRQICVSPDYLNGHSPHKDWGYATSSQASFSSVKKSLAAGNPVVLYTAAGAIYGPSKKGFGGRHIVVIVGFDPADNTFYINNPSPKKVDIATKTPNGRKMTEDHLRQFLGDKVYGHTYIIRKAFL